MATTDYNFKVALDKLDKIERDRDELIRQVHYAHQEILTAIMQDRHMADYCLSINMSKLRRYLRTNDMD